MNIILFNLEWEKSKLLELKYEKFYFDRMFKIFEPEYNDGVWINHVKEYNSRVTKIVMEENSSGYCRRLLFDALQTIPNKDLIHLDFVFVTLNNKFFLKSLFDIIQDEETDKYFKFLSLGFTDEEIHHFNNKINQIKSQNL